MYFSKSILIFALLWKSQPRNKFCFMLATMHGHLTLIDCEGSNQNLLVNSYLTKFAILRNSPIIRTEENQAESGVYPQISSLDHRQKNAKTSPDGFAKKPMVN